LKTRYFLLVFVYNSSESNGPKQTARGHQGLPYPSQNTRPLPCEDRLDWQSVDLKKAQLSQKAMKRTSQSQSGHNKMCSTGRLGSSASAPAQLKLNLKPAVDRPIGDHIPDGNVNHAVQQDVIGQEILSDDRTAVNRELKGADYLRIGRPKETSHRPRGITLGRTDPDPILHHRDEIEDRSALGEENRLRDGIDRSLNGEVAAGDKYQLRVPSELEQRTCIVNGAVVQEKNERIGGNAKSGADDLSETANGHLAVTTMRECESPTEQLDVPDVADDYKLRDRRRVLVEFWVVEGVEKVVEVVEASKSN
jgi:hypothetical protein